MASPKIRVHDRTLVYILFVTLAILSVITIQGNRDARDAAVAARIAALEAKDAAVAREYITKLTKDSAFCMLLTSGAVNSQEIPFEPDAMERHHNQCIVERSGPAPSPHN